MSDAVVVDNISKRFGDVVALDGVSLRVQEGAFVGLLGPNGAGKTTLIGALAGLVRFAGGGVCVMGHNVVSSPLAARAAIGIVPQELTYDAFFTAGEALRFQSKYYGLHGNRAWEEELLERLQLADKRHVNTRKLSGGMKRRLMIALALVHKPPLIVLDEPTAGVDINLRLSLWGFVRELNAAGHTIILTTHYLEEAEELCERVALLNKGRIVAEDKTAALLAAAGARAEARLRFDAPAPPPDAPPGRQDGDEWVFALNNAGEAEALLAAFRRANIAARDLTVRPPRLEDAFVRLMQK